MLHEYDSEGRLQAMRSGTDGTLTGIETYAYDTDGRLLEIHKQHEGVEHTSETYEYDGDRLKAKTIHVNPAGRRPDVNYGCQVEGTDRFYGAPGAATIAMHYDDRERPTELVIRDEAGQLLRRVEFRHDDAGNLIEEALSMPLEVLPFKSLESLNTAQVEAMRALLMGSNPFNRKHRYDDHHRRVETRSSGECETFVYNEYGDLIATTFQNEPRNFGIDDEGNVIESADAERAGSSESRFTYDYDAHGNWLVKTTDGRGGTQKDFTVYGIERRTITYFE